MKLSEYLPITVAVVLGGLACLGAAVAAVTQIESQSEIGVSTALIEDGYDWIEVGSDGLQVILKGTAPDEAQRFGAITTASAIVDASRVIDRMDVRQSDVDAPEFSVEILRNEDGISLIGLIPSSADRTRLMENAGRIEGAGSITDLLETADYPPRALWEESLEFGLAALDRLPRAKVSVTAGEVTVTAIAESAEAKQAIERELRRAAPGGMTLVLAISAPRPVLTPFTLRFVLDGQGARFDACSADSDETRQAILAAARDAGLDGEASCLVGLGQPSPRWGEAVTQAIAAVKELGGGSVTFSDADVTLMAPRSARQADFDRIAGRLEVSLPEVFSLKAVLPEPEPKASPSDEDSEGPPEFVATRSPEGQVQIRGRLPDDRTRAAVISFAHARFGVADTEVAARITEDLPLGWPVRVLASLEALSLLNNGAMIVRPDIVEIRGATGNKDAQDEIARLLASSLGENADFSLDIEYVEALDPVAALPTPDECIQRVNLALATRKITFEPGSTVIDTEALETIDRLAEALRECQTVRMEIGGHTDSQGRESMNERLSQERADAVLNAIMARRVLTSNLTAKGYGESRPIADNGTEDGREANRRIEFRLIGTDEEEAERAAEAASGDGEANEQN